MLIAHLPAGYLLTKALIAKLPSHAALNKRYLLFLGLFFSIVPDLDLFYFYFVDSTEHHHKLFPHVPVFWLGVFIIYP